MTAGVRGTIVIQCVVYRTDGDASVNIVYHSLRHGPHGRARRTEEKRTEQHLIVRSDKSEAEVTVIVLLKLTTDRHGLSATAQLLVEFTGVRRRSLKLVYIYKYPYVFTKPRASVR